MRLKGFMSAFCINALSCTLLAQSNSGLEYKRVEAKPKIVLHTIHVDPHKNSIRLGVSKNFGTPDSPSKLMNQLHGSAAINSGFFNYGSPDFIKSYVYSSNDPAPNLSSYHAFPDSILKVRNHLIHDSSSTNALGWKEGGGEVLIGSVGVHWSATIKGSLTFKLMNRFSTMEERKDIARIFASNGQVQRVLSASEVLVEIPKGQDEFLIETGSFDELKPVKQGDSFETHYEIIDNDHPTNSWSSMDYIVSGHPILVKDTKIPSPFSTSLSELAHGSRTGVCILPDGTWNLVVSETAITLWQFADALRNMTCKDAINLDGGPSSTMVFDDLTIFPTSFWGERPVSDAIVVVSQDIAAFKEELKHTGFYTANTKDLVGKRVSEIFQDRYLSISSLPDDPKLIREILDQLSKEFKLQNPFCEGKKHIHVFEENVLLNLKEFTKNLFYKPKCETLEEKPFVLSIDSWIFFNEIRPIFEKKGISPHISVIEIPFGLFARHIPLLAHFPNLRTLIVPRAPKQDTLKTLHAQLPNCQIMVPPNHEDL